jgi:hypothetical protein
MQEGDTGRELGMQRSVPVVDRYGQAYDVETHTLPHLGGSFVLGRLTSQLGAQPVDRRP